jgi:hypothetical protein
MFKRMAALAGLLAFALVPATASAATPVETVWLDMHETPNDGAAGPAQTSAPLTPNALYFVDVKGTFSTWSVNKWRFPCDSAFEPQPIYPSPGVENGRVGVDAEMVFSAPRNTSPCGVPLPEHQTRFEANTGSGFRHVEAVGGPYTTPTPGHEYRYVVQGAGLTSSFGFRFRDSPTHDNYGRLKIAISRADGEDCKKSGWEAFGVFKNQGDCVSYFATDGRNLPALA